MSHRAFAFDWRSFSAALLPVLESALTSGRAEELSDFISTNSCLDPNDGSELGASWESDACGDVQMLGDIALTAFYNPSEDFGLGDAWLALEAVLPVEAKAALLGAPVASGGNAFDPGLMGSYFQSEQQLEVSVAALEALDVPQAESLLHGMRSALAGGNGLYVTF